MRNDLISVIIPVYNAGEHLKKCLSSIVGQTYKKLEIILINDGSMDNSAEICKDFAAADDRIIFLSRENRGVSATRNEGISIAKGDYFSFIDADDYLEIDTYEYLIDIIKREKVDAVNFEHFITYPDREIKHRLADVNYGLFDRKGAQYQLVHNVAFAWNKLFSRKIIEGLEFDTTIYRGEDSLFARKAFDKADSVWFDSRPLLHYVQSENSAVRGVFRRSQLSAMRLYDIYDEFYSQKYPEFLSRNAANMQHLMIMIYFDMWVDDENYKKEQRQIFDKFKSHYKQALSCGELTRKQRLKFKLFKFSPAIFCIFRKLTNEK